ncbi:MAG TPA: hypothetical protein VFO91_20075 [Anaerolineales bacterium]|nr:hypothetical protein [Anaerolineales bacterium]
MQLKSGIFFRPAMLVLILVLILSACAPPAPIGPAGPAQPPAGPTAAEPTVGVQPTEAEAQPDSTEPGIQANLEVVQFRAMVSRGVEAGTEVQQAQTRDIQVEDRIEVLKLEEAKEQSYSILDFPGFVQAELFSDTIVLLADAEQQSESVSEIVLQFDQGHMFVEMSDETFTRLTVETPAAIIRTLEEGTDFDVCHIGTLTCIVVKSGAAEVIAHGQKEIVKAGAATSILEDEVPAPPVCAPGIIFEEWEENFRRLAATQALDQKVSALPKTLCASTTVELPAYARRLYQDLFRNSSSGWDQGKIGNYTIGYAESDYYQVQIQAPHEKILATEPNKTLYEDVNVDIKVFTEAASSGDFRYGLVFRRSENKYYALVISPRTKTWSFLKSSESSGTLRVLKDGKEDGINGLDAVDTIRLEASGSTFYFYINGEYIDLVRDGDYTGGEVGLFVQTVNSPDVLINFDSIVIWDLPPPQLDPTPLPRENCSNGRDDDADGLIDRADPDCERPDSLRTPTPRPPTHTPSPRPTTSTPDGPPTTTDTPDIPTDTPDIPTDTPDQPDPPTSTPDEPDPPTETATEPPVVEEVETPTPG